MFELLVLGFLGLVALVVVGLFASLLTFACWVLFLPFKILGLIFKGLGALLAFPFILLFGIIGAVIFGFGALLFLAPALPLVLLAALVLWLARRRPKPNAVHS